MTTKTQDLGDARTKPAMPLWTFHLAAALLLVTALADMITTSRCLGMAGYYEADPISAWEFHSLGHWIMLIPVLAGPLVCLFVARWAHARNKGTALLLVAAVLWISTVSHGIASVHNAILIHGHAASLLIPTVITITHH